MISVLNQYYTKISGDVTFAKGNFFWSKESSLHGTPCFRDFRLLQIAGVLLDTGEKAEGCLLIALNPISACVLL